MAVKTVQLGNIARDRVSGLQGTTIQRVSLLNGTEQFALQPPVSKKDPGEYPNAMNLDIQLLEYVGKGVAGSVTPPPATVHVRLGDQVIDTVTGITGIATERAVFINGCVYFGVHPESKDEKAAAAPKGIFVSYDRLKIVKAGAFKREGLPPTIAAESAAVRAARAIAATATRTGGPTTVSQRMS